MFQREEVTFDAVTRHHYELTRQVKASTYLVISDTTEIDYGYKSKRKGLGRLTTVTHRGFFLHSALVVGAKDGEVMGLGAQELLTRSLQKKKRVHRVKCRKRPTESEVWGRIIDRVQPVHKHAHLIHVCDRGADNFDVFAHLHVKGDSWVIRGAQLTRKVRHGDVIRKVSEVMNEAPALGSYQVYVAANKKQKARWAQVQVHVAHVILLRPREGSTAFVMDRDIREIPTNIVEVREIGAPAGCTPVRWVLYTAERVSSFKQAETTIQYYEKRPLVEEYHKCIKTGLRVEQRQYQYKDRLEAVIGVICVQGVRLLQLCDASRRAPDTPAKSLVPSDWLVVINKIIKRPRTITTVREFIRAVAGLGGFLGRKSDGEPGWQTIWHGMDTLVIALRGYYAGREKCG
jgi:hypothetical protein